MKLIDLHEMAVKAGSFPIEFSAKDLSAAFDKAEVATKLEGGEYEVRQKDDYQFALFKGNDFLSFAKLKTVNHHGKNYDEVVIFFTPKENRKLGYSTLLLYALKELRKNPLLFDGPIFDNGWSFLQSIVSKHTGPFQSVKTLNKRSGRITDFTNADPKKVEAFIIENDEFGFYRECGEPFGNVYYNMFEEELK